MAMWLEQGLIDRVPVGLKRLGTQGRVANEQSELSSFSGSFLQNQEYTKDTLGRRWGTGMGYTDERERVSASPFPSVMLSALYRPKSPQGLRLQPGHPCHSPVVVQGEKQPWPNPHLPQGAAERGQGAEGWRFFLPYP